MEEEEVKVKFSPHWDDSGYYYIEGGIEKYLDDWDEVEMTLIIKDVTKKPKPISNQEPLLIQEILKDKAESQNVIKHRFMEDDKKN